MTTKRKEEQMILNEKLANDLKKFCEKHKIGDTTVFFNNKGYRFNSDVEMNVLEDVEASEYFEFANDETVAMTFEGKLYHALNYGDDPKLAEKFNKIFEKHDCYYEFGDAWNLSVYYIIKLKK